MRKWLLTLLIGAVSVCSFASCMSMTNNNQQNNSSENQYKDMESVEELVDVILEEMEYEFWYSELVDAIDENSDTTVSEFQTYLEDDFGLDVEAFLAKLQEDDVVEMFNELEEGLGDAVQEIDLEWLLEEYGESTVGEMMSDIFPSEEDEGDGEEGKTDGLLTVKFDVCTVYETNKILDQKVEAGSTIDKPSVVLKDSSINAEIEGWYTDPEYAEDTKWSFLMDTVEENMTLYANWVSKYKVNYYLGSEESPMYTESVAAGTMYEVDSNWADGYKCNGFFLERELNNVTGKYDFEDKIEGAFEIDGDVNIYIDRSEELYFDAEMIATRFKPVAANGGKDGATVGKIEYVAEGDYAKVNFGYSPTVADSHIILSGVTVDITKSQKLRVTLKNVGKASSLKMYFISYVDLENKIFANGSGMNEACTSAPYRYNQETEMNMTEESEWLTIEFDMAKESLYNGVSMWGTSETLIALRFQSSYSSDPNDPTDLSNELWIKSIEGVADDTYTSSDDTDAVKELLVNDSEEDLIAASEAQESVDGFVFPKDRACVSAEAGTNLYNKTNGLLFYGEYLQRDAKFTIKAAEGQVINLDDLTTLNIRLRNYGYVNTLTMQYYNKLGRTAVRTFTIDTNMSEAKTYTLNMFQAENYNGEFDRIEIVYQSAGNDNAILFESITFTPFKAPQIVGFNFNDKNTFGVESNTMLETKFNPDSVTSSTEFKVLKTNAWFKKEYTQFALQAYATVTLKYKMDTAGITAVKLYLTVGGADIEYKFETNVTSDFTEMQLPLLKVGNMTQMRVVFEGTGTIYFREITFGLPETAVDYSTGDVESLAGGNKALWMSTSNYNPDMSAMQYTYAPTLNEDGSVKSHNSLSFYLGYSNYKQKGNIPLAGKTKMVIIYQNRTDGKKMNIALGMVDKSKSTEWQKAVNEPYAEGSTGGFLCDGLKTNMQETEWAAYEIDLFDLKNITAETINDKVVACILLSPSMDMYIRAVAFI